jgi:ATP-dependent Clp protease ATP-binding subunit ClpC
MTAPTDLPDRTARTHALVCEDFDGQRLVHPVAAPRLATYGREDDARAELSLFLREYFSRSAPEAKSRLSLP